MKKSLVADLALLFVAMVWGSTFVVVQRAVDLLPPLAFNGIRFAMGALFLLFIIRLFYPHQLTQMNGRLWRTGIFLGIWLFAGYFLQTWGLLYTTSSKAGFITGLSVVLVPIFAFLLSKQRIKPQAMVGVLLATGGLYLLTLNGSLAIEKGDFLVFLCAIAFAMHIVLTGRYTMQFPSMPLAFVQITTVSIMNWLIGGLLAIGGVEESALQITFSLSTLTEPYLWFALLITSLFCTALAYFVQTEFQKWTSPTRVALIYATEPVFAALTGVLAAGEILMGNQLWGMVLILTGMILAEIPLERLLKKRLIPSASTQAKLHDMDR
ncbi:DMT family transporter [Rubeoparvulum massiliense]|uniref:DMT family transporter n=1 Tax=Rubeoparvulum massiliense TaxID=1631346 RepID=UPI00065E5124|nr:DMT family transporter [Rubeoparvulum massiliense]